jgi:tetratricopeptide (TPR) repeat protein
MTVEWWRSRSETIVLAASLVAAIAFCHGAVATAWGRQWAYRQLLHRLAHDTVSASLGVFSPSVVSPEEGTRREPADSVPWPRTMSATNESSSVSYGAGIEALVRGDNVAAAGLLGRVAGHRTSLAGFFEGMALFRLGDTQGAAGAWERSGTLTLVRSRAIARVVDGVAQDAEGPLRLLATLHPSDPQAWMDVGDVNASLGRSDAAANAYERVLELSPHFHAARARLAQLILSEKHDPEGARVWAMAILSSDGVTELDAYNAYALLSRIALAEGDADASLDWAMRLLAIRSVAQRFGWREVAGVYEAQEQYTKALEALRLALDDDPSDPETLSRMGDVYQAMGDSSAAERAVRQALQAAPGTVKYRVQLAELLSMTNRHDLAHSEWQRVLALDPTNGTARARLASYGSGQRP